MTVRASWQFCCNCLIILLLLGGAPLAEASAMIDDSEDGEIDENGSVDGPVKPEEPPSQPEGPSPFGVVALEAVDGDDTVTFGTGSLVIESDVLLPDVAASQADGTRGQGVKAELVEQPTDEPVASVAADVEAEPAPECVAEDSGSLSVLDAAQLDADRKVFEKALLAVDRLQSAAWREAQSGAGI